MHWVMLCPFKPHIRHYPYALAILVWQSTSPSSSLSFSLTEHSSASFPPSFLPLFFVFFIRFHRWQKHSAPHLSCWLEMASSVAVSFSLISSCLLVFFSSSPLPCSPSSPHVPYHILLYSSSLLPSSKTPLPLPFSFSLSSSFCFLPPHLVYSLSSSSPRFLPSPFNSSLFSPVVSLFPLLLFFLFSSFAHVSSAPISSAHLSSSPPLFGPWVKRTLALKVGGRSQQIWKSTL